MRIFLVKKFINLTHIFFSISEKFGRSVLMHTLNIQDGTNILMNLIILWLIINNFRWEASKENLQV